MWFGLLESCKDSLTLIDFKMAYKKMKRLFLIVTVQRTGSTWLIQNIKNHLDVTIKVYEEIFSTHNSNYSRLENPLIQDLVPPLVFFEYDGNEEAYINSLFGDSKILVSKIMLNQIHQINMKNIQESKLFNTTLIYLNRNFLDVAISSARLKISKKAHYFSDDGELLKKVKPKLGLIGLIYVFYYILRNLYLRMKYFLIIKKCSYIISYSQISNFNISRIFK
jgi:hypothetical protein